MDDGAYRIISFAGFFTLAGAAWITGGRKNGNWAHKFWDHVSSKPR